MIFASAPLATSAPLSPTKKRTLFSRLPLSESTISLFFISWTDSIFKISHSDCAIDSSTNAYSMTSMFIIAIMKILFFNTQFINTNVSSNKSFFIKNDEMIKSFVFVASLTKIILFSISLYHFSRSFRQFWIFWILNNRDWNDQIRCN